MISATCYSVLRQTRLPSRTPRLISHTQQNILNRLLSTLAILEQREGQLQNASLSAVTAAQKLGGSITGFIAGSNVRPVAEEAAKVNGLEKIMIVENGSYDKVIMRVSLLSYNWLNLGAYSPDSGSPGKLCPSAC